MAHRVIGRCPVCGGNLQVARLRCERCDTVVEGRFELCKFCRLTPEQQEFVETFVVARGNLREMERILGVSYPTVRGRLETVIEALGYRVERQEPAESEAQSEKRKQVLEALSRGEIDAAEAIKLLKGRDG